jgi:uncharacterized protein
VTTPRFGLPTVRDILAELEKPGRDPRPDFVTARLADGIDDIKHLRPGMSLEGTVTNVAAFGAFVDIGVHQDGLVHVSQLADRFVKVRVTEVDVARKRIGLSMRKDNGGSKPPAEKKPPRNAKPGSGPKGQNRQTSGQGSTGQGALGAALQDAMRNRK